MNEKSITTYSVRTNLGLAMFLPDLQHISIYRPEDIQSLWPVMMSKGAESYQLRKNKFSSL